MEEKNNLNQSKICELRAKIKHLSLNKINSLSPKRNNKKK